MPLLIIIVVLFLLFFRGSAQASIGATQTRVANQTSANYGGTQGVTQQSTVDRLLALFDNAIDTSREVAQDTIQKY